MLIHNKILLYLLLVFLSFSCKNSVKSIPETAATEPDTVINQKKNNHAFLYGIPPDSFALISGRIKPNDFLSEILFKHGISMQEIDQVTRNSKAVFDVRRIRSGNSYILFCDKDSAARVRYMVYEHDPSLFYVISFTDSLNITPFRKQIKSEIRY
jgi:hypothetical protein